MDTKLVENALLEALRTSRATPLNALAFPYYRRELRTMIDSTGVFILQLDRKGCRRYKKRRAFRYIPPPANTEAIKAALNEQLAPDYHVKQIEDHATFITIFLEVLVC